MKLIEIILLLIFLLLLELFMPRFFVASGYSMYPTISPGDLLICIRSPFYKKGDIVAFKFRDTANYKILKKVEEIYGNENVSSGDFVITHRIVDEFGIFFVTKGDNAGIKELVPKNKIICKVFIIKKT